MIRDQVFSQCSGLLAISKLTTAGLVISGATNDYTMTQSKISITNAGADLEAVESSEGSQVSYGFKQIQPKITIEANDISSRLIATSNQWKNIPGTASASSAINPNLIIGLINTNSTSTAAAITAIGSATLATTADTSVYIMKRPTSGAISYYKYSVGVLIPVLATDIFTTAPIVSGTDEILVQFKISLPTSGASVQYPFVRDNSISKYLQISFLGFDSENNSTVSFVVPRAIIMSSVNYEGEKLKFNNFPINFSIPSCAENLNFKIVTENILSSISVPNLNA